MRCHAAAASFVVGAASRRDGTEDDGAARVKDLEAAREVAVLRKADPDFRVLSWVALSRGSSTVVIASTGRRFVSPG